MICDARDGINVVGGSGGVGRVREQELADSANYFGITDVQVMDHP
jgi:LmbE family N-acetylglucosaminyl deacetylase